MARRRDRRDLLLAWQSGGFSGLAFNGKLKPFRHYAAQMGRSQSDSGGLAPALHFFHSLKARGVPVKIERISRD